MPSSEALILLLFSPLKNVQPTPSAKIKVIEAS
jgi:hypothetical protein